MLPAALVVLAAIAIAARATYPRYLEQRASRRRPLGPDGIVVGAAPITLDRANAPGVLLLHGAGDTPQVFADMATFLHRGGFSVRVPLLSGHGRALSAFSTVSSARWHEQVEHEYASMRDRHDWVAVIGLSMGGALAVTLAARRDDVPALVLLAPYVSMPAGLRGAAFTSGLWGAMYPYFLSLGGRSIHDRAAAARGRGHGLFTPAALRALYDVVVDGWSALSKVRAPTLVIQSREDNRISRAHTERAFERLGSPEKKLHWIDGAGHVITVDYGHERVFELAADWLESHAQSQRPKRAKDSVTG
jgi:carboxylesterase